MNVRAFGVAAVPVVPGKDDVPRACVACGVALGPGDYRRDIKDGIELLLCLDFITCSQRFRGGMTSKEYAEWLRDTEVKV